MRLYAGTGDTGAPALSHREALKNSQLSSLDLGSEITENRSRRRPKSTENGRQIRQDSVFCEYLVSATSLKPNPSFILNKRHPVSDPSKPEKLPDLGPDFHPQMIKSKDQRPVMHVRPWHCKVPTCLPKVADWKRTTCQTFTRLFVPGH